MNIGDDVKQKYTTAQRKGVIIGIWDEDEYYTDYLGNSIRFACKGEYKVRFERDEPTSFQTFSDQQLTVL